jgi:hypothetical protein
MNNGTRKNVCIILTPHEDVNCHAGVTFSLRREMFSFSNENCKYTEGIMNSLRSLSIGGLDNHEQGKDCH